MASSHEQHMQQALERMNLKIHDVISDLTSVSSLKLVEAILQGERNPAVLLGLCDPQIQQKIAECDQQREAVLKELVRPEDPQAPPSADIKPPEPRAALSSQPSQRYLA